MRPSPLKHPLAVLRTTIGLTQKEMANLVGRATRTIQAIELGQLPLGEELALKIAQETGVDESWLLKGDPNLPTEKGVFLRSFEWERNSYCRKDYEMQQAYNASPEASEEELVKSIGAKKPEGGFITMSLRETKKALSLATPVILESADERLMKAMAALFKATMRSPDALLVRWKLRKLMEELAKERGIELPSCDMPASTPRPKGTGKKKR